DGHAANQRAFMGQEAMDGGQMDVVAGIARRDEAVAEEPGRAQALDRRLREKGAERGIVERKHVGQLRVPYRVAGGEPVVARLPGEFVPRADGEAIVAAEDAIAHGFAE